MGGLQEIDHEANECLAGANHNARIVEVEIGDSSSCNILASSISEAWSLDGQASPEVDVESGTRHLI